jgi:uncharacterized protein
MLYALICNDKPASLDIRMANRPAHIEFLKELKENLKFAGPFLDGSGAMNGSLLVIEAVDESAAKLIADADPYAKAGLFQSVIIRAWRWAINNPESK